MKLQVTLFATNGKYRPISTIINVENMEDYNKNKKKYQEKAILNICHNRKTTWKELVKNSYTKIKVREYDKNKIKLQAKKELLKKLCENYQKKIDNSELQYYNIVKERKKGIKRMKKIFLDLDGT